MPSSDTKDFQPRRHFMNLWSLSVCVWNSNPALTQVKGRGIVDDLMHVTDIHSLYTRLGRCGFNKQCSKMKDLADLDAEVKQDDSVFCQRYFEQYPSLEWFLATNTLIPHRRRYTVWCSRESRAGGLAFLLTLIRSTERLLYDKAPLNSGLVK